MERAREGDANSLPALLTLFGSRGRSCWPLQRQVVALGRASGCDICLDAPEVSSLHCLIWRNADGLFLRDCNSRSGTLINGETIVETALQDSDVLQVGSFSFRVFLPANIPSGPKAVAARLRHLDRSRRNLGQLALALRKRLKDQAACGAADPDYSLNRKASGLRNVFQHYQQRMRQLEQAERELARDRELFAEERENFLAAMEKFAPGSLVENEARSATQRISLLPLE